jgi:hypothetical protein
MVFCVVCADTAQREVVGAVTDVDDEAPHAASNGSSSIESHNP